jgi:hypothetical protein
MSSLEFLNDFRVPKTICRIYSLLTAASIGSLLLNPSKTVRAASLRVLRYYGAGRPFLCIMHLAVGSTHFIEDAAVLKEVVASGVHYLIAR